MKVVTWNLRSVYIGDGINGFIHRSIIVETNSAVYHGMTLS